MRSLGSSARSCVRNCSICLICCVIGPAIWSGCAQVQQGISAPKDANSVLAIVRLKADSAVPFRANGQGRFGFIDESGRTERLSLPINLFVNPPYQMYLQGQAGVGPAGLVMVGCNKEDWWLVVRPKVNTYWYGRWSDRHDGRLPVSPGVLLESLGIVSEGSQGRWALSTRPGRYVLTWLDATGTPRKRIYLEPVKGLARRIEYLDVSGKELIVVELSRYERLTESFFVPSRITMTTYSDGKRLCWAALSLSSILHRRYSDQFGQRYFQRPEPYGFDKVIELE